MGNRLIRSELGRKFLKIGTCEDKDKAQLITCKDIYYYLKCKFIKAGNDVGYAEDHAGELLRK